MYIPEGVPGILVQPAWGSFPWNRATCKRSQDWMLYANQVVGGPRYYPRRVPHQEKGSACWGTLFCMLTCKMSVLHVDVVASTVSDAKLHVVTLCMLTCIRDFMHVNMHCCVCQHA